MVKWFEHKIDKKVNKAKSAYSMAIGQALVNQMSDMAHVRTGLLRNSITYIFHNFKSPFGKDKGPKKGRTIPEEEERVSQPPSGVMRVGSAVVYANAMEKNHGWASKGIDEFKRSQAAVSIGKAIFRKFFK